MKTVGQILRSARQEKDLSIETVANQTRIDPRYIEALENDRYQDLPGETFTKGFIRNISLRLDRNPEELIAIFRRDFRQPGLKPPVKDNRHHKRNLSEIITSKIAGISLAVICFVVYLVFQFRAVLTPPNIQVVRPSSSAILTSPIEIEGMSSPDAMIIIDEDTQIKPDSSGHFIVRLALPVGEKTLNVKAISRFGRSRSIEIPLTIVSN